MGNTKKPPSTSSRITRPTAPKAPRAARKKSGLSDAAAEALGTPPDASIDTPIEAAAPEFDSAVSESVAEPAPAPVQVPVQVTSPAPEQATPIPWTAFREAPRARSSWLGIDGRALVKAAVKRLGRAVARRFPFVGRVGGFILRVL